MKVLLAWPNFEPTNAAGVRGRALARHLAEMGVDVRALTVPDPRATEDAPVPVETARLFLHPQDASAVLSGADAIARAAKNFGADVVVASSPPSTFLWQASRGARKAGVPLVADVRDLYTAGMRAVFGNKLRYVLAERFEASAYAAAAFVTPVTELMREKLLRDFPAVDPRKVVVVPNGADPLPRPPVAPRRDLDVLFVGEMFDRGRRGEELLRAYARVLRKRPQTKFTFLGWQDNPYTRSLLAAAPPEVRRALDLHGRVPRERVADFTLRAKVGVVPVNTADVFRTMLPAKAYEYVESSLPVAALGHKGDSELRRFVEGHEVGLFSTDEEELAENVLALLASERERMRLADNARRVAPTFHRRRAAETLFKDVLAPVVEGRT